MHYDAEGAGPTLVLLPGLGCDGRVWQPVGTRLARRFRVVRPHLWGLGSLERAARGVVDILDRLGEGGVGVAGLSMGGYVAFHLLRHWPERVRAAALVDTTAFPDTADRAAKRQQVLRLIGEGQFPAVLDAFATSVLAPATPPDGALRDLVLAMGQTVGAEAFAADARAIAERGSFEDVLALVRVPCAFVFGELDQLTPPELGWHMAREVPGARVEVIPGAGHLSPLEAPGPVASALEGFFAPALGACTGGPGAL